MANATVTDFSEETNKRRIYRVVKNKDNPYVQINKTALHDPRLSWKAKGLHAYMLSMPDDWIFYREELLKHSPDGPAALRSGFEELKKFGYLDCKRLKDKNGHFIGWETNVFESPEFTEMRKSNVGEPASLADSTEMRFSDIGKSNATNNDLILNNDKTSTNKKDDVELDFFVKEGVDCKNAKSWIQTEGFERAQGLWMLSKKKAIENPIGYMKTLIKQKASLPGPIKQNENVAMPRSIFTRDENVAWFQKLNSDERKRFYDEAVWKHFNFDGLMKTKGLDIQQTEFVCSSLFGTFMDLIGRNES